MSVPIDDEHLAGQAVYAPWVLGIYDFYVLWLSNRLAWGCTRERQLAHYEAHLGARHLDVGVGTGWYLDHARFPDTDDRELWLLDLNENSLGHTRARVARYAPRVVVGDVLGEVDLPRRHFDSIGMNYLVHCLPGEMSEKARAFATLADALADDGGFFGSTILNADVEHNAFGRALIRIYNRKGIFGNARDDAEGLRRALREAFDEVNVTVEGTVALFSARVPRR